MGQETVPLSRTVLRRSEGPLAPAKDGNGTAVTGDGVDVQPLIADHKVHVLHRVVDAKLTALVQRHVLEAPDRVGKTHAQSQVTGGVLVKQGVVKQQAGLGDGGIDGHQRTFAQIGGSLVHRDHLLQQRLVLLRLDLDGLAVFKADREVLDQLAVVGQRLGGVDDALSLAAHRRDEALLGGDIGIEEDAAVLGAVMPRLLR